MKKNKKILNILTMGTIVSLAFTPLLAISCNKVEDKKNDEEAINKLVNEKIQKIKEEENKLKLEQENAKNTEIANKTVSKYWDKFLNENHGRWSGNKTNFNDVNTGNDGIQNIGTNGEITDADLIKKAKFNLDTKIEENVDTYGSFHAYLWLKKELTDLGYKNNTEVVKYPAQAQLQEATGERAANASKTYVAAKGTKSLTKNLVVREDQTDVQSKLNEDGFVTQGFLWHGKDAPQRLGKTYNNFGTNIIVTINPDKEKFKDVEGIKDLYITSHYDSTGYAEHGQGGDVIKGRSSWGATDNATGVAITLAMLKHYSNPENRKNLGVRLHIVFADAEEMGVYGTTAFVNSFVEKSDNVIGAINLDTVSGGDHVYVHSRGAFGTTFGDQVNPGQTAIRDQIIAISQRRAELLNDLSQALEIHPSLQNSEEFEPITVGGTGDWSDHEPFHQKGIRTAYFESTNFDILSKYEVFDGYAQVKDDFAWIDKNGNKVKLVKQSINGGVLEKWVLPEGMKMSDIKLAGDIWHSDFDTPQFMKEHYGNRVYKQLDTIFESITEYIRSVYSFDEKTKTISYID
ncbi:M28 family peptidase [Mycoplasma phocoenae]|uniref:Zn-dependent exopeptidase M28 n=1 Tax=Mycoplasma phocoenae TaxID=754517 RepID=A0A858U6V9_9MOLU|nr:M28 family peptidase [Mycoplasma phocoenae]QJG67187.1 Zn-dependent exopeptidase M28 [Mycoplasma phocoenae]